MFINKEEALILRQHKHREMLNMFRNALTKISALKQTTLHVSAAAHFLGADFSFDITVFVIDGTNTTLTIYDFWEVKESQKVIDAYILAIKTGDFEKVTSARTI